MSKNKNSNEMADLLKELEGSTASVNSLTSKVKETLDSSKLNVVDILSETSSQLAKAGAGVDTASIVNATSDSVLENRVKYGANLAQVMSALQKLLDKIGFGFEGIKDLNDQEKGWIQDAEKALERAKNFLTQMEAIPEYRWWKPGTWGRTKKIASAKESLANAEVLVTDETARAHTHYQTRLENEPLEDQLQRMISIVTKITEFVQSKMGDIQVELEAVTASQKDAFKLKEKAAESMKNIESSLENLKADLKVQSEALSQLTPDSPEYTTQQQIVEATSQKITEAHGSFEVARAIFNSKERFVELHAIAMEALETQIKNLKADLAALKSDTKEREDFYAATIVSLRAAAYQKITSTFEKAGVKTDQKSAELLGQSAVASQRSRIERIEAQAGRVQDIDTVTKTLIEKQREFMERSKKATDALKDHYGIDPNGNLIIDEFSNGTPASDGNSAGGTKDTNKELEGLLS